MNINNPNIYDGTKTLIATLNNDYTFYSFEESPSKEKGFHNPLFVQLERETAVMSHRPGSIESRENIENEFRDRRRLLTNRTVDVYFLTKKFTFKAKTYSNYKKMNTFLAPYILLILLIIILFLVFKINVFLDLSTRK